MNIHENNLRLISLAKKGDKQAENELVMANMGLVKSIAQRFIGRGEELDDLVQLGAIGLIKASRGYDESFGTLFSTYAVPMIMGEIRRFLRDTGPIKVSRKVKRLGAEIAHVRERYLAEYAREPTVSELSHKLGESTEDIVNAITASSPTMSLQESIGEDNDALTLESTIAVEDEMEKVIEWLSLEKAIEGLDSKERLIVKLRYNKCMTQAQVGKLLGFSQVKVSRLEKRIIEKLRNSLVV